MEIQLKDHLSSPCNNSFLFIGILMNDDLHIYMHGVEISPNAAHPEYLQ